eukprot:12044176-Alexandrium_andersonii.AAC.1
MPVPRRPNRSHDGTAAVLKNTLAGLESPASCPRGGRKPQRTLPGPGFDKQVAKPSSWASLP